MPSFQRHVFVCINERAPTNSRGCCKAVGGEQVRSRLKSELTQRGIKHLVRANKAGCLDQCEHGVTVVVYPEQVWYGGVTVDDVGEIVQRHLIDGEYVTRLMLPDQAHLGDATGSQPLVTAEPTASSTGDPEARMKLLIIYSEVGNLSSPQSTETTEDALRQNCRVMKHRLHRNGIARKAFTTRSLLRDGTVNLLKSNSTIIITVLHHHQLSRLYIW